MAKKATNETKVVCPVCGTEFAIPEHGHMAVGFAVGKDSGLGIIHPAIAGTKQPAPQVDSIASLRAVERLEALKKAGVDTTGLFAMEGAAGGMLVRQNGDQLTPVSDDDPIFAAIIKSGTVPDRRLFRRWVMSQMFHMIDFEKSGTCWRHPATITEQIHWKGYEYMWRMTLDEFRVQVSLWKNKDFENFEARNRWFNKELVVQMAKRYIKDIEKYFLSLSIKHCKGVPYSTINGQHIFRSDFRPKYLNPMNRALAALESACTPESLYKTLQKFNSTRITSHFLTQDGDWMNAYKGAGAYYTLQNMVRFHNCLLVSNETGKMLDTAKSLVYLDVLAEQYRPDGYKLLAYMKKVLEKNKVDVAKKIAEWRK